MFRHLFSLGSVLNGDDGLPLNQFLRLDAIISLKHDRITIDQNAVLSIIPVYQPEKYSINLANKNSRRSKGPTGVLLSTLYSLVWLSHQLTTNPDDLFGKHIEIVLNAAMIGDRDPQAIAALQGRVRGRGNSLFMELHENLFIQGVELFIIQPTRVEAEADNIETDGSHKFHAWFMLD
jgi:hypothetical protein